MTKDEKIEQIEYAIELIREAKDIVWKAICNESCIHEYTAYGEYGFCQLLGEGNSYDNSLENLINEVVGDEVLNY